MIVIPAFSRGDSLKRLLDSISVAYFPDEKIKIIISLDGGYSDDVYQVATDFADNFTIADVEVIAREENLGLRKHILLCGDFSILHGSCIVLEDDLIVSKTFYLFACQANTKYSDNDNIAGISLYAQRYNEYANLPFEPNTKRKTDVYFMQVACSWGQVWSKEQWIAFKKWYEDNLDIDLLKYPCIPKTVALWPNSSWKKYYSSYLILNNKYYVYPYVSFSSNCADNGGTHNINSLNTVQVPLNYDEEYLSSFLFSSLDDKSILYDGFMEPILSENKYIFGINSKDIQIDLYGTKPVNLLLRSKYSISSKNNIDP
ncbi:glycosyltransferase family 2 protein, partial [Photobacterium phosphoreum]|uniref:glycosyltransferase family 2 protein n=1 Tax=Photobacterium phosphoreum TaxID=659 RepID=UPI0015E65280